MIQFNWCQKITIIYSEIYTWKLRKTRSLLSKKYIWAYIIMLCNFVMFFLTAYLSKLPKGFYAVFFYKSRLLIVIQTKYNNT